MRRTRLRALTPVIAMLSLALAGTGPSASLASPPVADPPRMKAAKEYVKAGLAAQAAGNYGAAVRNFAKAYEQVPHKILLFNIAQAHRLAGQLDEAIEFYTRYLAAEPKGARSSLAQELLGELTIQKAERDRTLAEARRAELARHLDELRREAARWVEPAIEREAARQVAAEVFQRREHAHERTSRTIRRWGLAIGSAGVVSATASLAFGRRATQISDEVSRPGATYDPTREREGKTAERYAISFGVAGAALIAGGAITYWSGYRKRGKERIAWAPLLTTDGGGIALNGVLP
jgi:tetratricopeptide (TPR) repeat protein